MSEIKQKHKNINLTIDDDENAMTSAFILFSLYFFFVHSKKHEFKSQMPNNTEIFFRNFANSIKIVFIYFIFSVGSGKEQPSFFTIFPTDAIAKM
jgi:hypothetical protein